MSCQEKRTAGYRIQADKSEETATLRTASIPQPAIIIPDNVKEKLYSSSANIGSQAGNLIGS